jgi:hypothetical protein
LQGQHQTAAQLIRSELRPAAILFDDGRHDKFNALVGRETLVALLQQRRRRMASFTDTRVSRTWVFAVLAEWTFHGLDRTL